MSLIRLDQHTIVNADEIATATRCGNYTEVRLLGAMHVSQIWDEDKSVWRQIEAALVDRTQA